MAVAKECRLCGNVITFQPGETMHLCSACGAQNMPPPVAGNALTDFRHAIRLQKDLEFDRARASYDFVLNSDPGNAEALWGRLLCYYGAAPVSENGQIHYMIHRPDLTTPLRAQADYAYIRQLATPEFRAQIEAEAAYIDNAILRIRQLADTKPDFDVFLCHKCSTPDGNYTEDYKRANNLYLHLTAQGYRVFFAPVEMEKHAAGENYEAMIYHALNTSRVMLVVCSDPALLQSKWVQGEWMRFLRMMSSAPEKKLLPLLYGGMKPDNLPDPFRYRHLQCINMEGNGYTLVDENLRRILGQNEVPQAPTDVPAGSVRPGTVQPPPRPKRSGIIVAMLAVLVALAVGAYLWLNPPTTCTHPRSSWIQTDISYAPSDSIYHTITEEKSLICEDCGRVLQRTTAPASLEKHTYSGSVCQYCAATVTPTPGPTACPHTDTHSQPGSWSYFTYNDDAHEKRRSVSWYCSSCGALVRTSTESTTESHRFSGDACSLCNAQATPTPKPTQCPHPQTTSRAGNWTYATTSSTLHEKTRTLSWYCSSCSALVRTSTESTTESHRFSGDTCSLCNAQATPTPKPTQCPHPQTTSRAGNWTYATTTSTLHEKTRTLSWYCSSCGALVRTSTESTTESHSFSSGTCSKCGAHATPTPTPKPTFNTTLSAPSRKKLSYESTVNVYSGPGTGYFRAANGKAECSVHRDFYIFGYENGWYMIRYDTNAGAQRVGYIQKTGNVSVSTNNLNFAYRSAVTNRGVSLTDDPDGKQGQIVWLSSGSTVTYLATYGNWYYIECSTSSGTMRGFIPTGSLNAK